MELSHLSLVHYRNLAQAVIPLDARFTVLWGHNGAGKTNLLEAIYLVSTYRSFRTNDQSSLVQFNEQEASVTLKAFNPVMGLNSDFQVRIKRHANSTRKRASIDGKAVRAAKDFYGRVRAILFTPEDLSILRGSPSGRRQFLDRVLFARDRGHITDIQDYEKTVRARNKVLKGDDHIDRVQRDLMLDSYDQGIADLGGRIGARRRALVRDIRAGFLHAVEEIHGAGLEPSIGYESSLEIPDDAISEEAVREGLADQLRARRSDDLLRRITTVGPHRDDLRFQVRGASAAEFASQGQARALVLAFKIAELRLSRADVGHAPVLLLDDVSSELDADRNAQLFELLGRDAGQCVLTTTAPSYIRLPEDESRRDVEIRGGIVLGQ